MNSIILVAAVLVFIENFSGVLCSKKKPLIVAKSKQVAKNDLAYYLNISEFNLMNKEIASVVNPSDDIDAPLFAATVLKSGHPVGAGAIIAKNFLLTACSLLKDVDEGKDLTSIISVSYPVYSVKEGTVKNKNVSAAKLIPHPDCGKLRSIKPAANIGIIQTKGPMEGSNFPKFPKLPTQHIKPDESQFFISNYRIYNKIATNFKQAIWYVITKQTDINLCEALFEGDRQAFSNAANICMSYFHQGDGNYCQADVGAPLSVRYNNEDTLIGLIIHKHECGHPRELASFVCVKTNKAFINGVVGKR